jgi:hypothetical protein
MRMTFLAPSPRPTAARQRSPVWVSMSDSLKILLTTFNKELVKGLGNWIEELLNIEGKGRFRKVTFSDGSANFYFNSNIINIQLLHFEMLAKNIGNINFLTYINWFSIYKSNQNNYLFNRK